MWGGGAGHVPPSGDRNIFFSPSRSALLAPYRWRSAHVVLDSPLAQCSQRSLACLFPGLALK